MDNDDKIWKVVKYVGFGIVLLGTLVKEFGSNKQNEKLIQRTTNKYLDNYMAELDAKIKEES